MSGKGDSVTDAVRGKRVAVKVGDFICIQLETRFVFGKVRTTNEDGWALTYLDWQAVGRQVDGARTWVITADSLDDPSAFWAAIQGLTHFVFWTLAEASAWARPFLKDWTKSKRNVQAFLDRTGLTPESEMPALVAELDDATLLALWAEMCKGIAYGPGVRLRNLAWDMLAERTKVKAEQPAVPARTGRRIQGVRRVRPTA